MIILSILDYEIIKKEIKEKFDFQVNEIKYLGGGVDSNAYLINNDYVFKFGISVNSKLDYEAQKIFSDFYKHNIINDIETPDIEYYYNDDETRIIGYKYIEGKFLNRKIYNKIGKDCQEKMVKDIAMFLKKLHKYNENDLNLEVLDIRKKMLAEVRLIKNNIYYALTENERKYINRFEKRVIESDVFDDKKCLCHIDFNPTHILIDKNNSFRGVIDWGGAAIVCKYAEFSYILSDSEDEIGRDFGLKVLEYYKEIDVEKAIEYSNIHKMEYPITELVYGIENNKKESIDWGKKIIAKKCETDEDIKTIMV